MRLLLHFPSTQQDRSLDSDISKKAQAEHLTSYRSQVRGKMEKVKGISFLNLRSKPIAGIKQNLLPLTSYLLPQQSQDLWNLCKRSIPCWSFSALVSGLNSGLDKYSKPLSINNSKSFGKTDIINSTVIQVILVTDLVTDLDNFTKNNTYNYCYV